MLLGQYKESAVKRVAVVTRNPAVTLLLSAILGDWGFTTVADPAEAVVSFVERGMNPPRTDGRIVWLTPMPLGDEVHLELPLSLTSLYHMLEEEFFPSPRRHIRATLNRSADLQVNGDWEEVELTSLSDRGGRLSGGRELSKGTVVTLEVKLAGRVLRLPGEILYCIPSGDAPGRERPQLGMLFKSLAEPLCTAIRSYVERTCVRNACAAHQLECSDLALSWIELARDPLAALS